MTVTIPLDLHAVDLAWVRHRWDRTSSVDAAREMEAAGVQHDAAVLLVAGSSLPSTSGQMAGVR